MITASRIMLPGLILSLFWNSVVASTFAACSTINSEKEPMQQRRRYKNPPIEEAVCFEPANEQALVESREEERLAYRLRMAFEIEPFEDGMDHPADQIIENALRSSGSQSILDWLSAFCLDTERPNLASSVLRCLGRQTHIGTDAWRAQLVRNALATDDIEIRDAAVQAAESWGGREVVNVLMLHNEPESWLQEYILEVIDDLQG